MKVIFKTGVMSAGKTADLLSNEFNFRKKNIETFLVKPSLDTRSKNIKSRLGIEKEADFISNDNNDDELINKLLEVINRNGIIFFDESQFLNKNLIKRLDKEVFHKGIKTNSIVFFYGLLTDFNNNLFETSSSIISICDELIILPTTCQVDNCMKKATRNFLLDNVNSKSDTIHIGDDCYLSVCSEHYNYLSNKK